MSSITELARRAGVSITTVSRVLNKSSHPVSEETRLRVLQAAAELNFRPNMLAQAMVTQRTRIVGVIVGDSSDPYFSAVVRGIEHAARERDYLVIICNSDRDLELERNYLSILRDYRVAGVIFAGGSLQNEQMYKEIAEELDAMRTAETALVALNPHVCVPVEVEIDNAAAAREMTEHLLALGHRRIAFIQGPANITTSALRFRGYVEALTAADITPDPSLIWPGSFDFESGFAIVGRFLATVSRPTAIFAANDQTAIGAIAGLRQAGVTVPGDVSVAGFDDIQSARYTIPSLTTIRVPMYELGMEGVKKILALLDEEDVPATTHLAHQIVVRDSTSSPKTSSAFANNGEENT